VGGSAEGKAGPGGGVWYGLAFGSSARSKLGASGVNGSVGELDGGREFAGCEGFKGAEAAVHLGGGGRTLISSPGVEISENAVHLDALDRYQKTTVHFVDCLLAAAARAEDSPVATFDEDFRKFGDVRIENA